MGYKYFINKETSDGSFFQICILGALLFSFSFNSLWLTKYHFLFGQASFYFIFCGILSARFMPSKKSFLFIFLLIGYCVVSGFLICWSGIGICTVRPYTGIFNILFVWLIVEAVSSAVSNNPKFELQARKYLIISCWLVVILGIPEILSFSIPKLGIGNALDAPLFELVRYPNNTYPRLREFTQEPSYLGQVISVLYPIALLEAIRVRTLWRWILVLGLWTILYFSSSRLGILSCVVLSAAILMMQYKRFVGRIWLWVFASMTLCIWSSLDRLSIFLGEYIQLADMSTNIRAGALVAAVSAWKENIFFGVGLGQLGFLLPNYYPYWVSGNPEVTIWTLKSNLGGASSFSFLPKILAELGLFGILIPIYGVYQLIKLLKKEWHTNSSIEIYFFCFCGFLISSFGVEGYLYLPAWIVFGILLGLLRNNNT